MKEEEEEEEGEEEEEEEEGEEEEEKEEEEEGEEEAEEHEEEHDKEENRMHTVFGIGMLFWVNGHFETHHSKNYHWSKTRSMCTVCILHELLLQVWVIQNKNYRSYFRLQFR